MVKLMKKIKTKIIFLRKVNETNKALFALKNFKLDTNNLVTLTYQGVEKSFAVTYKNAFLLNGKTFIFYIDWDSGAIFSSEGGELPIADPKIINYLFKANVVKQFTKGLNTVGLKFQVTTLITGLFIGLPIGMALMKYVFGETP
jgi:hypothetical protein